ncbi:M48 family metallopeptidase [Azospirillum sp. ST 5-10]|uniref:M48 family metallopeptidase n=1 Tax=unclassified Azospirillum TaxID=2630922 RepID=UPI003F4A52F4
MPTEVNRTLRVAGALAGCLALTACADGATGIGVNLVTQDQLAGAGQEEWQRLRATTPASDDPSYQRRAEAVSGRLLQAAGLNPGEWEVAVFDDDQANAFALPGQKIGVYAGLFRYARTDAQLAAVIGHEIAHNLEAHAAERASAQLATETGVSLLGTALGMGGVAGGQQLAAILGTGAQYGLILPYSRNQELEADAVGLTIMARAGYDPREALTFWRNMQQDSGPRPPVFLSTHPGPEDRIAALERLMPQALEAYGRN